MKWICITLIVSCICVKSSHQLPVKENTEELASDVNDVITKNIHTDNEEFDFVGDSENGDGLKTTSGKFASDNKRDQSADDNVINPIIRRKRENGGYFTDHGYGSRMEAGQNMAKDMAVYGDVYGKYGPGKRSRNLEGNRKRYVADNGYGSRVDAGSNLANSMVSKESVFGSFGPGKRNRWHDINFGLNSKPNDNFFTDNGYGSRIDTGSALARDVVAVGDLFGRYGPGRRKRIEQETDSDKHEEMPEVIVVVGDAEE